MNVERSKHTHDRIWGQSCAYTETRRTRLKFYQSLIRSYVVAIRSFKENKEDINN